MNPGLTSVLLHQAGAGTLPYWLTANRTGFFDTRSSGNLLFSQEWRGDFLPYNPTWDVTAQASYMALVSSGENRFFLPSLAVHATGYDFFRISVGRYPEIVGFTAPFLSTGAMMMSLNARPIWKISVENTDFWSFPGSQGFVQFKGRWSEGITTDERYMDGANVHQKYLYINVKPHRNLNLMGGVIHQLQWGGVSPDGRREHVSFRDYLDSVIGISENDRVETPLGNSIAAYDFAATFEHELFRAGMMRLFYLEDLMSMQFRSPWDGLWSGWFHWTERELPVNFIVYEHINTKQQDARMVDIPGRANYYMHARYRGGWTHHSHGLGSPLFTVDPEQITTEEGVITNGIMVGHHLGVKGHVRTRTEWSVMATWTRNYGVCRDQLQGGGSCFSSMDIPFRERDDYIPLSELRKDRYSLFAGVSHKITGQSNGKWSRFLKESGSVLEIRVSVAADWGDFFDKPRFGVETGLVFHHGGR